MSARYPTDVEHSLALLQPRGGGTGPHADGWGVGWYEGRAAAIFKECAPAADSQCFGTVAARRVKSTLVIAHIRRANPPEIGRAWANTHPFEREVGGRSWVFAHNGKLPGVQHDLRFTPRHFRPMGDTDSEHAFCTLLDRIVVGANANAVVPPTTDPPLSSPALLDVLRWPVQALSTLGEFNFLLGDGRHLVVHAHTRLAVLQRRCRTEGCTQQVALVATQPLTDEPWQPLAPGLHVFVDGEEARLR